jgi:hypothetical protein
MQGTSRASWSVRPGTFVPEDSVARARQALTATRRAWRPLHAQDPVLQGTAVCLAPSPISICLSPLTSTALPRSTLHPGNRYFCPSGSPDPYQRPCGSASLYCPPGAGAPIAALPGEYTVGGTPLTRSSAVQCTSGSYCVDGMLIACPAGRYGCSERLSSSDCNGWCTAGFYCPTGSSSSQAYVACVCFHAVHNGMRSGCDGLCGDIVFGCTGLVLARSRTAVGRCILMFSFSGSPAGACPLTPTPRRGSAPRARVHPFP